MLFLNLIAKDLSYLRYFGTSEQIVVSVSFLAVLAIESGNIKIGFTAYITTALPLGISFQR